ncbi:hypothetical protein C1H46_004299 [Malus baccata]|uniref:KNOX2 domain-containing protein n=1 Tax=Malus baccata TaxID=106549 RepID=A0A540NGI5_MALBA|nr:hypothetical protein C1H46_004299 [Malus baccata]
MQESGLGMMGGGGIDGHHDQHNRQLKAEIATHPLYEQLLSAHVSCLRVATPIDQLPLIDAQLSQSHHLLRSYASQQQHGHPVSPHERQELDNFLAQYLIVLCSFKEQLQQHVRVHAVEAVMACREIESNLQALTGINDQLFWGSGSLSAVLRIDNKTEKLIDPAKSSLHDLTNKVATEYLVLEYFDFDDCND